ncbi:hypothetical protein BU23DRAFT_599911 [Bimuria novae-zelandiae CBS 107.79]|uniref:Uncharacterized protein n=1 Tax=Bimuria novae-zelandiae CBS 107.79 TaxID=1447943 RepID=A0A6A5V7F9_9PLEO|nr:hypothetical protein BU23DRAFT_599911 [Bimuria novae-zelandiae CBS 107.79]
MADTESKHAPSNGGKGHSIKLSSDMTPQPMATACHHIVKVWWPQACRSSRSQAIIDTGMFQEDWYDENGLLDMQNPAFWKIVNGLGTLYDKAHVYCEKDKVDMKTFRIRWSLLREEEGMVYLAAISKKSDGGTAKGFRIKGPISDWLDFKAEMDVLRARRGAAGSSTGTEQTAITPQTFTAGAATIVQNAAFRPTMDVAAVLNPEPALPSLEAGEDTSVYPESHYGTTPDVEQNKATSPVNAAPEQEKSLAENLAEALVEDEEAVISKSASGSKKVSKWIADQAHDAQDPFVGLTEPEQHDGPSTNTPIIRRVTMDDIARGDLEEHKPHVSLRLATAPSFGFSWNTPGPHPSPTVYEMGVSMSGKDLPVDQEIDAIILPAPALCAEHADTDDARTVFPTDDAHPDKYTDTSSTTSDMAFYPTKVPGTDVLPAQEVEEFDEWILVGEGDDADDEYLKYASPHAYKYTKKDGVPVKQTGWLPGWFSTAKVV